ncbi:MAG: hydrolase [Mogibacterium sp.]|nr:hydrolase [Mogibacterium sp.]MBQ3370478.1 hydrolase [Mogibacterium sp.]
MNRALKDEEIIPSIQSRLRHNILIMPKEIREASGILIFGRRIKSLVFTTDLAIIKNCDADAVFAVYPFTPQQSISDAIIRAAAVPVFTGIGGGITKGLRSVRLAKDAESQGAFGVVLNAPTSNRDLKLVATSIDIPVVITVTGERSDIRDRLRHGASIINVAAGERTPDIVRMIDSKYPDVPIIASGGSTPESIRETIRAGANAITYTPPTTKELFVDVMEQYREKY